MKLSSLQVSFSLFILIVFGAAKYLVETPLVIARELAAESKELNTYLSMRASLLQTRFLDGDISDIRNWAAIESSNPESAAVLVVDQSGTIIASSHIADEGKSLRDRYPDLVLQTRELESEPHTRVTVSSDRRFITGLSPFLTYSETGKRSLYPAFVYVKRDLGRRWSAISQKLETETAITGVAYVLVISIFLLIFRHHIQRRVNAIQRITDLHKLGASSARIDLHGSDEIAGIAANINSMLDSIDKQHGEIVDRNRFISLIYDISHDGIIIIDRFGRIDQCNSAAVSIFGYTDHDQLSGKNIELLMPMSFRNAHQRYINSHLSQGPSAYLMNDLRSIKGLRANGVEFPIEIALRKIELHGEPYFVGFVRDDSERMTQKQKIENLAFRDQQTKLLNRNGVAQFVEELRKSPQMHITEYWGFYLVAIDSMRSINASFGFEAGDRLITALSTVLREQFPQFPLLACVGSNRFLLGRPLLNSSSDELAEFQQLLQICRLALSESKSHSLPPCTLSGGVYIASLGDSLHAIVGGCELALLRAKTQGTGQAYLLENTELDEMVGRSRLMHELSDALDADELHLVFQPKIALHSGQPASAEGLIRWTKADGTAVSPAEFIPLAESGKLITKIDYWVLHRACRHLSQWQKDDAPRVPVALNVSARTFYGDEFPAQLQGIIDNYGVDPNLLEIEITEYSAIKDVARAAQHIAELEAMGVSVAIDDFGMGNSNLDILLTLPVRHIKIDQSFIRASLSSKKGETILSGLVDLALALGLTITAEGVEQIDQVEHLKKLGCTQAQGYYFSKPLTETDYLDYLRRAGLTATNQRAAAQPAHEIERFSAVQ